MQIKNLLNPFFVGMKIKFKDKPSEIVNEDSEAIILWMDKLLSSADCLENINGKTLSFIFQESEQGIIHDKVFEMAIDKGYIFLSFDNKIYKIQIAKNYLLYSFPKYTIILTQSIINEIKEQIPNFVDIIRHPLLEGQHTIASIGFGMFVSLSDQILIIEYIKSFAKKNIEVLHDVYDCHKNKIIDNNNIYGEYGLLGENSSFILEQYDQFIKEVLYCKKPTFSEEPSKVHSETQKIIDNLPNLFNDLQRANRNQPENEQLKKVYEKYEKEYEKC